MSSFDPNNISVPNGNYFALPYTPEESRLVLLSVPWDVTTSYRPGTSLGPDAIIAASAQVDLYDHHCGNSYEKGIGTLPIEENILEGSNLLRRDAEKIIHHLEEGGSLNHETVQKRLARINKASVKVNEYVYRTAKEWIEKGKTVGLVGGDHSTPLGLMKVIAEKYPGTGILHIDAHADLREAYEGFTYSHASIMYNMLNEAPGIGKLVQVGIRDLCDDEINRIRTHPKIKTFFDYDLQERKFRGDSWEQICGEIFSELPEQVYLSFDIDGLSPELCPSTGTPVPGGLSFHEAIYLIRSIIESGRTLVGFDLTEVAPSKDEEDEWDANVGARVLYKLCNFILKQE